MNWWYRALAVLGVLVAAPAIADSWSLPERTTYLSADKATRFTVIPRDLENQLAYFTDKVDKKDQPGQRAGGEPRARGILERRDGSTWTKVWEAPLVNDVAPVTAIVANGGGHVVTFDNWHSMGFGDNVVVLYRGDGSLVRAMKLTDILPEDYVRTLPTTVGSMWWSGKHGFSPDGRQVILKVVIAHRTGSHGGPQQYLDVPIDLATGAVERLSGPVWDRAMAAAAPHAARSKAAEAEWRANRIAPLRAPTGTGKEGWPRYLYQARERLRGGAADRHVFTIERVLPATTDPTFARDAKDIRDFLANTDGEASFGIASPAAPDALADLLIDSARRIGPGKLANTTLLVALPARRFDTVRAAFRPSGADLLLFDPAIPIPQRPEVLREMGVAPDAVDAEAAKAAADARRYEAEAKRLGALAPPDPPKSAEAEEDLEALADRLEALADETEKAAASPAKRRTRR